MNSVTGTSVTGHFSHWPLQSLATSVTGHFSHWPLQSLATSVTGHFSHWPLQSLATSVTGHFSHWPLQSLATSVTGHFSHWPLQLESRGPRSKSSCVVFCSTKFPKACFYHIPCIYDKNHRNHNSMAYLILWNPKTEELFANQGCQ